MSKICPLYKQALVNGISAVLSEGALFPDEIRHLIECDRNNCALWIPLTTFRPKINPEKYGYCGLRM